MTTLRSLLTDGGRILVAGAANSIIEKYTEKSQVVIWDQKDLQSGSDRIPEIPSNIRCIITGTFLSHMIGTELIKEARRRNLTLFHGRGPDEMRQLLDEILAEAPVKQRQNGEKPDKPIQLHSPKRGELRQFVVSNWNRDAENMMKEADRLVALARLNGLKTTRLSMRNAIHILSNQKPVVEKKEVNKKKKEESELIKLVDSAILSLQLVRDELRKVGDTSELKRKLKELIGE